MKTLLLIILCFLLCMVENSFCQIGTVWISQPSDGVIIMSSGTPQRPFFAVTNYAGNGATVGKKFKFNGKKIGVYMWGDSPIELWDVNPKPPQQISSLVHTPSGAAPVTAAQEAVILENQIKQIDAQIAALEQQRELKERQLEQVRAAMK